MITTLLICSYKDHTDQQSSLVSICEENMAKDGSVMKAVSDYADVSTVHGISYAFSRSLPQVDRLFWTILTTLG